MLRTRAEVTSELPIYDAADHEKTIGTLSVRARVQVPLLFDPKDKSGADVTQLPLSDAERETLVFVEDADSLDGSTNPAAATTSVLLGSVPDSAAPEPAPPKRGGAALAAARAPVKAAAASGVGGTKLATAAEHRTSDSAGDTNLKAVAEKYKLPVAILKQPEGFVAYGESYVMLEQQMGLIALEIQVRSAQQARCRYQLISHRVWRRR